MVDPAAAADSQRKNEIGKTIEGRQPSGQPPPPAPAQSRLQCLTNRDVQIELHGRLPARLSPAIGPRQIGGLREPGTEL